MYRKYVWRNKHRKPMLYVQLNKALLVTLQATLKFGSKAIIEWGFKLNEYDPCVNNKTINSKQFTIIWNIYDLKTIQ